MDFAWIAVGFSSYIALKMFQSYCDLEAGDTKSLKLNWQNPRSNPGPLALALQVRVSTTAPPLLNPCSAFRAASFAKNSKAAIFYCLEFLRMPIITKYNAHLRV